MVAIVYLATNGYKRFFRKFYESLDNFMPDEDKILYVYTDDIDAEEFKINFSRISGTVKYYEMTKILDMPWPIVALEKFAVILDVIKEWKSKLGKINQYPFTENLTHLYMWDSSVYFRKIIPSYLYKHDKLVGVLHYAWDYVKGDVKQLNLTEEWSYGYTNCEQYPYVCSGSIAGPIHLIEDMCNTCIGWMKLDLRDRRIPRHDDESYFVRYFTELSDDKKIVLPADFDFASDPDWCPDSCDDPYIESQPDDDQEIDKWYSGKQKLPIDMDKIPNKQIHNFEYLRKLYDSNN